MKQTKEITIRTSAHAPHIAIEKDCYILHDELIKQLKNDILHNEKLLNEFTSHYNKMCADDLKEDYKRLIKFCEKLADHSNAIATFLNNNNIINYNQFKYYNNLINNKIRYYYDVIGLKYGL